jgi:energy-coupling factor transporter ATP-binding protein EcfA2
VVAVSHDARFVAESFGRAIRLDAGRVVEDGPPAGDQ